MPPKKAVAEGATTRAQSSQGQSINDEVNDTEDLTSDVPALVATLTGSSAKLWFTTIKPTQKETQLRQVKPMNMQLRE